MTSAEKEQEHFPAKVCLIKKRRQGQRPACCCALTDRNAKASLIEGKGKRDRGYAISYDEGVGGQVLDLTLESCDIQGSCKLQS